MANDWEMPRRSEACNACEHVFEPGEALRACLYESPEGYARRDFCPSCEPPADPPTVASWQTHRPLPAATATQVFDRQAIYQLFVSLADADQPQKLRLRFVLALLLWRKKALKFEGSDTAEEGEVWQFAVPKAEGKHRVLRPDLDEEQLERLGMQLETILESGGEGLDELTADESAEQSDHQGEEPNDEPSDEPNDDSSDESNDKQPDE